MLSFERNSASKPSITVDSGVGVPNRFRSHLILTTLDTTRKAVQVTVLAIFKKQKQIENLILVSLCPS